MLEQTNSFYAAAFPRTDGHMCPTTLLGHLARIKGVQVEDDVFVWRQGILRVTVNDNARTAIATFGGNIVYSDDVLNGEPVFFDGPWWDHIEILRNEIEQAARKAEAAKITHDVAMSFRRPAAAGI